MKGTVRVICRVRPVLEHERKCLVSDFALVGSHKISINNGQRTFKYDRVLKSTSKQNNVFEEVQPLIESAMQGFNVCVMAYG